MDDQELDQRLKYLEDATTLIMQHLGIISVDEKQDGGKEVQNGEKKQNRDDKVYQVPKKV